MRRVPKKKGVHRDRLFEFVIADLKAASSAGRIYVDADFMNMRSAEAELTRMISKDRILEGRECAVDPELGSEAKVIYRTDHADEWLNLVPVAVQAVVDFLPTANLLDLMLAAIDGDDEDQQDS